MPVISASLFARFASRQQSSPTMQAVAALRGQFGGHQVMTVAEGEELRAEAAAGPTSAATREQEGRHARRSRPSSPKEAAARGRKADQAGPSSGTGDTSAGRAKGAASAGPTSGTSSTRKRAASKS